MDGRAGRAWHLPFDEQAVRRLTEDELEDIVDGEPPPADIGELEDLAEAHRALLLVDLYMVGVTRRGE